MLSTKKLLYHIADELSALKQKTKTTDYTNPSYALTGGERGYALFGYPSGMNKALSATLISTPNADWITAKVLLASDGVRVYMHNEYSSQISGTVSVRLVYI